MKNRIIIFNQTGVVNQIYGILPDHLSKVDNLTTSTEYNQFKEKNEKSILEYLRYDNEHGIIGCGSPEINPSIHPAEVVFHYNPVYYRQRIANNLPYKLTDTITVIDSFACLGSRFGLKSIMVFVEVYKSSCGENKIWANIFYVADSEIPVCTIRISNRHIS